MLYAWDGKLGQLGVIFPAKLPEFGFLDVEGGYLTTIFGGSVYRVPVRRE